MQVLKECDEEKGMERERERRAYHYEFALFVSSDIQDIIRFISLKSFVKVSERVFGVLPIR